MSVDADMEIDRQLEESWRPTAAKRVPRTAYLDIETATAPSVLRELAAAVDHASPAAFVAWLTEHAADRALDPIGGRVVCWALCTSDELERSGVDRCPAGDEPALLRRLLDALDDLGPVRIVTWNGRGFDLPFLRARALAADLPELARWVWSEKPWDDRLIDASDPAWYPRPARGGAKDWSWTLDAAAELLGIERPATVPGAEVPAAWYAQRFDSIEAHCVDDVRTLRAVARRLASGRRSSAARYWPPKAPKARKFAEPPRSAQPSAPAPAAESPQEPAAPPVASAQPVGPETHVEDLAGAGEIGGSAPFDSAPGHPHGPGGPGLPSGSPEPAHAGAGCVPAGDVLRPPPPPPRTEGAGLEAFERTVAAHERIAVLEQDLADWRRAAEDAQVDLEEVGACLDRMRVPSGVLAWRLGWLEGRLGPEGGGR